MGLFSLREQAERGAKYRYLSVSLIVIISLASFGFFLWLTISLPWWIGLPVGIAVLAVGFLVVLKLVNLILPEKLPANEGF